MGKSGLPPALGTSWQGGILQLPAESHPCGGTASATPKSPWKLYPQMQKPIAPAAAQLAVLGSAQCSSRALLLPGFGVTPKKTPKELVWVSQGRPNPRWIGERWGSGCNRPWEIPMCCRSIWRELNAVPSTCFQLGMLSVHGSAPRNLPKPRGWSGMDAGGLSARRDRG